MKLMKIIGACIIFCCLNFILFVYRFVRMFLMLHAQAIACSLGKPLISFDGGFLDQSTWGKATMLVCVGMDGESRDIVCAVSINPSETAEAYEYLIKCMRKHATMNAFLSAEDLCIITDQSKGLTSAIKAQLPQAYHRYSTLLPPLSMHTWSPHVSS